MWSLQCTLFTIPSINLKTALLADKHCNRHFGKLLEKMSSEMAVAYTAYTIYTTYTAQGRLCVPSNIPLALTGFQSTVQQDKLSANEGRLYLYSCHVFYIGAQHTKAQKSCLANSLQISSFTLSNSMEAHYSDSQFLCP